MGLPNTLAIGSLAAACLLPSCTESKKLRLTDTEGRSFTATCQDAKCAVDSSDSPSPTATKPPGGEPAFTLHRASRFFAICDVWSQGASHAIHPADCRPLACTSDAECPPAVNLPSGTCTNGLCIEPSAAITGDDAVLLCLAGTGPPAGTNKQIERYALGNACGNPCSVPSVCRQP